jgi:SulP family sulfate permease
MALSRCISRDGAPDGRTAVRLRGRTELGATFFHVINDYAQRLEDHGSRLYLSGLDPHLLRQSVHPHRR